MYHSSVQNATAEAHVAAVGARGLWQKLVEQAKLRQIEWYSGVSSTAAGRKTNVLLPARYQLRNLNDYWK